MNFACKIISAIGFVLLLSLSAHAETITPGDSAHHVGSSVTVEGVVSQVSVSSGGTIFINFGGRYPNQEFYGVIFKSNSRQFSEVRALEGQTIALSGTVQLYKGRPQIILQSPSQITLRH